MGSMTVIFERKWAILPHYFQSSTLCIIMELSSQLFPDPFSSPDLHKPCHFLLITNHFTDRQERLVRLMDERQTHSKYLQTTLRF